MKRNLKKTSKIIALGLVSAVFAVGILSGCSKNEKVKDVSVSVIMNSIKEKANISEMREADSKKLEKLYAIKEDEIKEFALYTAPTNLMADEIAVFKVENLDKIDSIKEKIEKRIETQGEDFKDYLPEQYNLIENNLVKNEGNYVLFVISEKVDDIEEAFDKAIR